MLTVARGRSYYRNILLQVYPDLAKEAAPPYYRHVTTRWVQQTREQTKSDDAAPAPAASPAQDPRLAFFAASFSSLGKYSEATGGGGTAGNSGNA
jgi:hypothetical protein